MNSTDIINFARRQLEREHTQPTDHNVSVCLAQIIVCYLNGGKLNVQAVEEISKTPAPVVGHKETDVDGA